MKLISAIIFIFSVGFSTGFLFGKISGMEEYKDKLDENGMLTITPVKIKYVEAACTDSGGDGYRGMATGMMLGG